MYFTYILQGKKHSKLYIGFTNNIEKRLKQHNKGESQATKPYKPYKLIFYEAFINKQDAKARERYLKSGWGRKSINKMISFYFKNNKSL